MTITYDVRPGDRYVHARDGSRMTITKVDGAIVITRVMGGGLGVSDATYALPLHPDWNRVGREPKPIAPPEMQSAFLCAVCTNLPADPGQVYCWRCSAECAYEWADLTPSEADDKTVVLQSLMKLKVFP
jgi:hypothetical protein